MRHIIVIGVVLLVTAVVAIAQTADTGGNDKSRSYLYQWVDENGTMHVTDELGKVPKKYLDKVRTIEEPKKNAGKSPDAVTAPAPSSAKTGVNEEARKAEWQQRLKGWRERLARAEKRYQDLDLERTNLMARWGVRAYAPPETVQEYERMSKEMEKVKKEIDEARNMVDVVIPEEARKAGVPPGWLRE